MLCGREWRILLVYEIDRLKAAISDCIGFGYNMHFFGVGNGKDQLVYVYNGCSDILSVSNSQALRLFDKARV